MSPSFTSASGPPTAASGLTCSTTVPNAVPLMRASEMRTMSLRPFEPSFFGIGSAPASGMPGAPTGPALRSTITDCGVTLRLGSSIRASRSSSESNTTAGPFVLEQVRRRGGDLDRGALRREVAVEHRDRRALHHRIVERADHLVVDIGRPALDDVADGLAVDQLGGEIEMILQPPPQRRQAAGGVEVLHEIHAGGLEIEQRRHVAADAVEFVEVVCDAGAAGDGGEMHQRVGRAGDRLQHHRGILQRRLGEQLARLRPAGLGHRRRRACRPPRRSAQRSDDTAGAVAVPGSMKPSVSAMQAMVEAVPITMQVPDVGMSWSCARPSSGPSSEPARIRRPQPAAVGAGAEPRALVAAGQHRADVDDDGRHVGADRAHQLGGDGLVAAADQHHGVERQVGDHLLDVHRHQIAQQQGGRTGERLVQGDGREDERQRRRRAARPSPPPRRPAARSCGRD